MRSSWTCRSTTQPTPQYGHTVDVTVWTEGSHVPASRMSYSGFAINAPVGQTPMQLPQYTHADSGSGTFCSVEAGMEVQTVTSTICPYCGVGCAVDLHVQDDRIVKVTSPLDSTVTEGHLCIKGRFGFEFVNERPKPPPA